MKHFRSKITVYFVVFTVTIHTSKRKLLQFSNGTLNVVYINPEGVICMFATKYYPFYSFLAQSEFGVKNNSQNKCKSASGSSNLKCSGELRKG